MLTEPAIWAASLLERAWHQSIADIWQHTADCVPCSLSEAAGRQTYCSVGLALRDAEQAAYRATKSDMYVPLALAERQP